MNRRRLLAVVTLIGLGLSCGGDSPTRPSPAPAISTPGSLQVVGALSPVGLNGFIGRFDAGEIAGAGAGSHAIPGAPANLTSSVSGNTVTISWTAASGDPTTYVIEAGSAPGAADLANFATGILATSFTGVAPNGTYFVRVKARNPAGTSPPSNEITIVVGATPPPCTEPPRAVTELAATGTGTTATLTWKAPAGSPPTSYVLEVGSSSGASDVFNADVGNVTRLTGVAPPAIYFARVRAKNACGTSSPSGEVSFGTCTVPPGLPTALTFSITSAIVTFRWKPPTTGDPHTFYRAEVGDAPGRTKEVVVIPRPATSWTDNPPPGGNSGCGYARLKAANSCGFSAPSNEVFFAAISPCN